MPNFDTGMTKQQLITALTKGLNAADEDDLEELTQIVQGKANSSDLTDEETARTNADNKIIAALVSILDSTGAKNRLSVNSGTTGSGYGYFVENLPINLPPGTYIAKMTRDTSGQLNLVLRDASNNELVRIAKTSGVTNFEEEFTITGTAAKVSVYVGYSVTITDAMICSKAAYEISSAYVPYAPTNAELYNMINNR